MRLAFSIRYPPSRGRECDRKLIGHLFTDLMRHLPLFIGESGPTAVSGVGNYVRSIRSPEGSLDDRPLFTKYFLDSHATVKKVNPWAKSEYDYIKADQ